MKPPTMRDLLDDPFFRPYVKTIPPLAPNLTAGTPWAVWARLRDGRWRGANVATYRDAWTIVVKAVRNPGYEDVSVVSRRQLFVPTPTLRWNHHPWSYQYDWCGRCRRPTSYAIRPNHHALRKTPVLTFDEPYRCYYCGARRVLANVGEPSRTITA
jgi:hypothetical protein